MIVNLLISAVAFNMTPIVSYLLDNSLTCKRVAFVGAEGFGAKSVGGRDGKIYHVSNLNDSGIGSFRACAQASEKRICVFDIGGTIVLNSSVVINSPYISIIGHSAPKDSGGITLRAATSTFGDSLLKVHTHDVIIRYIRLRRGEMAEKDADGNVLYSSGGDNLTIGHSSKDVYNIMIDHCSISWGFDENIDTYLPVHDITIQNSISSEALHLSSHTYTIKGIDEPLRYPGHSKGSISYQSKNFSLHNNLYASNEGRNPRLDSCTNVQMSNLLIYNWGSQGGDFSKGVNSLESSLYIYGPNSDKLRRPIQMKEAYLYINDVKAEGGPSENINGVSLPSSDTWEYLMGDALVSVGFHIDPVSRSYKRDTKGQDPEVAVSRVSSQRLEESLLSDVGASFIRDSVDIRVINDVKNREGSIINSPSDIGGWPVLARGTPIVDTDKDGMSDVYEDLMHLDKTDSTDANKDSDKNGFSNIEEYFESRLH